MLLHNYNSEISKDSLDNKNILIKKIKFKSNYSKKQYFDIVNKAKTYIKNGDIFQVVPSQRFESNYELDAKKTLSFFASS